MTSSHSEGQRDSATQHVENVSVKHKVGYGLLHAGQHWHGTHTLVSGTRENFVMWGRSSELEGSADESFHTCCGGQKKHVEARVSTESTAARGVREEL